MTTCEYCNKQAEFKYSTKLEELKVCEEHKERQVETSEALPEDIKETVEVERLEDTQEEKEVVFINDNAVNTWRKNGHSRAYEKGEVDSYVDLQTGEIHGDSFEKKGDIVIVETPAGKTEAIRFGEK